MSRVNITVPDRILGRARAAGLNVSQLATGALSEELDRLAKIAELDEYLRELEAELGPIPAEEASAARKWADAAFDQARTPAPRSSARSA